MECHASKEVLSIEVFFNGTRFPLEHFLPILGLLSLKFYLKVLSIKFPLKYFLLTSPTFKRVDVALSRLTLSKTICGSKPAGTIKRLEVASSLLALSKGQTRLLTCWHLPRRSNGS